MAEGTSRKSDTIDFKFGPRLRDYYNHDLIAPYFDRRDRSRIAVGYSQLQLRHDRKMKIIRLRIRYRRGNHCWRDSYPIFIRHRINLVDIVIHVFNND